MKKIRALGETSHRPSVSVRVPKKVIRKEPVTLMMSVPRGNVSKYWETRPFSQKRPIVPSAPPKPSQRYIGIKIPTVVCYFGRSYQPDKHTRAWWRFSRSGGQTPLPGTHSKNDCSAGKFFGNA